MSVTGMAGLKRRLAAIGRTDQDLRAAQRRIVAEAKRNVPRKTGNLGRSIQPGYLRMTEASVEVRSNYARFVEEGTGLYGPRGARITPRNGKVMVWKGGGPAKVRLSGRSRTSKGKSLASTFFATSTKGRKATPFLKPAVDKVAKDTGIIAEITKRWNEAD